MPGMAANFNWLGTSSLIMELDLTVIALTCIRGPQNSGSLIPFITCNPINRTEAQDAATSELFLTQKKVKRLSIINLCLQYLTVTRMMLQHPQDTVCHCPSCQTTVGFLLTTSAE